MPLLPETLFGVVSFDVVPDSGGTSGSKNVYISSS